MTPMASAFLALDGARLTVVELGASDGGWAEQVLAERPDTHLHALPPPGTGTAIDDAVAELGIRHINYLRIANADAALPALLGARRLLSHCRIDIVEIVGDAARIPPIAALLARFDFVMLPPSDALNQLLLTPFGPELGLLALHRRFIGAIAGGDREPDLGAVMTAHKLTPGGIIHVGAHEGQEAPGYLARGFARVLLIEADPGLAAGLVERFRDEPRIAVASCAITDHEGTVDLHVASQKVANSILPFKQHAEVFPEITETGRITVPARRLDDLLAERAVADDDFNILVLDIQGAELMALHGASRLLPRLDGLLIEVNFVELYQGCAQIEAVDDLLAGHGFARVMTMSPYRSSYGDAFYLKTKAR